MRLILTRQRNGDYMLSGTHPIITHVKATNQNDAYIRAGDPIGIRHLCREGVLAITNQDRRVAELNPLESMDIELTAKVDNG